MQQHTYEYKIKHLENANKALLEQLISTKKKREEASNNAGHLAEQNFYLQNCLCEVYTEIGNLTTENERLVLEKRHRVIYDA